MLFTHFYLSEKKTKKKTETWTVSPISRYTAKYVFSQVQLQNQLFQSVGIQLQCPCTNPLNCLRNIGTIVITQKLTKTASNSFSLSNSSQKLPFFCCFDVFTLWPAKCFKFKRKYQQIQPAVPNHHPVSYDYGARDLVDYFHFYSIVGQKFKMQKELFIKKNLNNCMP